MAKITYADKSQVASYNAAKWNAQDINETKDSVNALYDEVAVVSTAVETANAAIDAVVLDVAGKATPAQVATAAAGAVSTVRGGVAEAGDTLSKLYSLISTIQTALASDETTLDTFQEVVDFIQNNRADLDTYVSTLAEKVDIDDIVNTLTETVSGKVLDARQGKALKDLIDALTTSAANASNLTSGTLPIARIADGAVTEVKLATDVQTKLNGAGSGYAPTTVATYADALTAATGTGKKLITVTATGQKYYYEGTAGVLLDSFTGLAAPPNTLTFNPVTFAGGAVYFDEANPTIYAKPSGTTYNGGISAAEMDYIVVGPLPKTSQTIIGKLADGKAVIVATKTSNAGQIRTFHTDGNTLGSSSVLLPNTGIPDTAVAIKYEYNSSGDFIVSYKTSIGGSYITYGTVTKAALVGAGFDIVSQQMGGMSFTTITLLEFKVKNGAVKTYYPNPERLTAAEILTNSFPYNNKVAALYGDSVLEAIYYPTSYTAGVVMKGIKSKLRLGSVVNKAKSGYGYGMASGTNLSNTTHLSELVSANADLYILNGGVNDFLNNIDLGDPDNPTTTTATTFVGGLNAAIVYLQTNRPTADIYFVTPLPYPSQATANTKGLRLIDYVNAIIKVCNYYSVPVYNAFHNSNFKIFQSAWRTVNIDGLNLHPTDAGYELLLDQVSRFVNSKGNGGAIAPYVPPVQTLTDAATINWYINKGRMATVTLGGNRTLAIPDISANKKLKLIVKQDATGGRTLALPANSKVAEGGAGVITLTATAGAIDILDVFYDGTNYFWTYAKNFS